MATVPVSVLGLATAVPDHVLEQSAVADLARRIYAKSFTALQLSEQLRDERLEHRCVIRQRRGIDLQSSRRRRSGIHAHDAG